MAKTAITLEKAQEMAKELHGTLQKAMLADSKRKPKPINSWHPSKFGSCLTGAFLERIGVKRTEEFDERTLMVFKCGNMFEEFVVQMLETKVKGKTKKLARQGRILLPELDITGYDDVEMAMKRKPVILEVKSKHSKAFWWMVKEGNASFHHRMQLWIYLKARKREVGFIVYVSKDDLALQVYPVLLSETELEEAVLKEAAVLNAAWHIQVVPVVPEDQDKWKGKYCGFHAKCLEYGGMSVEEVHAQEAVKEARLKAERQEETQATIEV